MLTFDAGIPEANQPGTYYGSLQVKTDTPYPDDHRSGDDERPAAGVVGQDRWVRSAAWATAIWNPIPLERREVTIESDTGAMWIC